MTVEAVAAGERPEEPVGPGEGGLQRHRARCPERAAAAGVGAGEFAFF